MRTLHCQVPSRMRRACASQSGSTMLLGIGVGAVVLALILILATATAIYLDLKRLTYLADNCVALAAREVGSEGQLDALAAQKTASSCVAQQGSDPNGPLAGSRLSSVSLTGLSMQVKSTGRQQPPRNQGRAGAGRKLHLHLVSLHA